jgi:hypothetical protein
LIQVVIFFTRQSQSLSSVLTTGELAVGSSLSRTDVANQQVFEYADREYVGLLNIWDIDGGLKRASHLKLGSRILGSCDTRV